MGGGASPSRPPSLDRFQSTAADFCELFVTMGSFADAFGAGPDLQSMMFRDTADLVGPHNPLLAQASPSFGQGAMPFPKADACYANSDAERRALRQFLSGGGPGLRTLGGFDFRWAFHSERAAMRCVLDVLALSVSPHGAMLRLYSSVN